MYEDPTLIDLLLISRILLSKTFLQGPQGPQGIQGERGSPGEGLPGPKVQKSFALKNAMAYK